MKLQEFIGERIRYYRNLKNMNQEELADMLNTTKQAVSRYENGNRQANQDILFELSNIFDVCIDDFFPKKEDDDSGKHCYPFVPMSISAGIPLGIDGVTELDRIEMPDMVMGKYVGSKDIFIMRVNGNSMNNVIPHGSLIIVKKVDVTNIKDGDIVVYNNDTDYAVKRFYKYGDKLIFKPDSDDISFPEQRFDLDEDIKIHGKVVMYLVETE